MDKEVFSKAASIVQQIDRLDTVINKLKKVNYPSQQELLRISGLKTYILSRFCITTETYIIDSELRQGIIKALEERRGKMEEEFKKIGWGNQNKQVGVKNGIK